MPRRSPRIDRARIGAPLASAVLLATVAWGAQPAVQDPLIVACRPDASMARPGTRVTLRAFARPAAGAAPGTTFQWKATAGILASERATVEWQLPATPGAYTASVDVRHSSFSGACTVRVFVVKDNSGRGTETRSLFLTEDQTEDRRFRRHSYVLLGAPPGDARTKQRYLAALAAFTSILPLPGLLQKDLNLTVLPVKVAPKTQADAQDAAWLFTNYDWERSRRFLKALSGDHLDGPYIVTYREPLSGVNALEKEYLYQDLTRVPPDLVAAWVREFVLQAAQEQFWEVRTGPMLALKMRTVIDVVASALPDAKSVAASIAWR